MVVDDKLAAAMRQWGATEAQIAQARRERGGASATPPDVVDVWPENWDTWQFFLAVQTQWVFAAMGMAGSVRVAMNYPGVESIARMRRVPADELERRMQGLQVIELAVLEVEREMSARRAEQAKSRRGR